MARKSETGIEYFPMNTDIIHNPKIKLVVAEFGSELTWAVLLPLYCKIYREKGYWIDWCDEDSKMLFAQDECKVKLSTMNELVAGCIRRSLFDKRVFDLFGVLTSDRIQENYLIAKKRNKNVELIEEFLSINQNVYNSLQNVNIIDLNVNIIKKKVNISKQKKKEIIELEGEGDKADVHTESQINAFKNFQKFILQKAATVAKMKEPFTVSQFLNLKKEYSTDQIAEMVLKMHNYKPLLKKNNSAYLTFLNWAAREFDNSNVTVENDVNEKLKALWNK